MRDCGTEFVKKCLKCGHVWLAFVIDPKKCPKCQSYCWNRHKKSPGRKPEFSFENIPVGRFRLYPWTNDKERDHRLNKAVYAAQRKNSRLVVTTQYDGLRVHQR